MPPTEDDSSHACEKQNSCLDWAKFVVEVITLVVLIFYAAVNYCLYDATRKSADAARDSADAARDA